MYLDERERRETLGVELNSFLQASPDERVTGTSGAESGTLTKRVCRTAITEELAPYSSYFKGFYERVTPFQSNCVNGRLHMPDRCLDSQLSGSQSRFNFASSFMHSKRFHLMFNMREAKM